MLILINYEKVFRYLGKEKAKNSIDLSENEIMALLQLMFDLGVQYSKVSTFKLDSSTKKFYKKFSSKKGLQLFYFLITVMTLEPNKLYKPNELNNKISANFRNLTPNLLNYLGLINSHQFYSIKKDDSNLIRPRELTELLQIMTDDCKILEKIEGIENIKEKNDAHPGRKKEKEIINYEGFPSRYKLSNEYLTLKTLFNKSEFLLLFRNFINKSESIKNYLIFTLNTMFFNSSKLMEIKIKSEDKERLKNELINKENVQQKDIIQMVSLLLLFLSKEEIKHLSNRFIDANLASNDYTFILFFMKLSFWFNKKKSNLKIMA
jgi:hypothetical protein